MEGKDTTLEGSIGVVRYLYPQHDTSGVLPILNQDGTVWKKFRFMEQTPLPDSLHPFAFGVDYPLMVFKCTRVDNDYYEIIVNESNLKKRIRKSEGYHFEPWAEHVLHVSSVGFDPSENPIRQHPDAAADTLDFDANESYYPEKIDNDWMQIKWGEEGKWEYGWVRWKNEHKMLIELLYID